jgi:hypothetical protein
MPEYHSRYKLLRTAVASAVDEADPIRLLAHGCPGDEYAPEIRTIVPRVCNATDVGAVRRIIHEEFVHWFGDDIAGPESAYESLARRVWSAVEHYRTGDGPS